jgi:aromatic ring-opening dioxygenase catalytic subunit (LigB family)
MAHARMPVIFLPHGGGPWPFVDVGGFMAPHEFDALSGYLTGLAATLPQRPTGLVVISAHWEASVPTVMTSPRPPMLYDYGGFPPEAYTITWPAPGSPELAARVRALLEADGFSTAADPERGFDHGTFVPLKLVFPKADVPAIQLSLLRGLDPVQHVAMGRALAPLRDEGVLIVGSGMSFHNLRAFRHPAAPAIAKEFDTWLREIVVADPDTRDAGLVEWTEAPSARLAHPREEHLLPLMVIAGAAGEDRGSVPFNHTVGGALVTAAHFNPTA